MDVKLLKVLENCHCLDQYKYFTGVSYRELRNLPLKRLKTKLNQLLSAENKHVFVSNIVQEILNDETESSDDDSSNNKSVGDMEGIVDIKPKLEIIDLPAVAEQADDEDDEISIVHEELGEVSFVSSIIKSESVLEVTVDDNEDVIEGQVPGPQSDMSSSITNMTFPNDPDPEGGPPSGSSAMTVPVRHSSAEKKRFPKRYFVPKAGIISRIEKSSQNYVYFSGTDMTLPTQPAKRFKSINKASSSGSRYSLTDWTSLYAACASDRITFLDAIDWSYNSLNNDTDTPDNLYRILSDHCTNLKELWLYSNCSIPSTFSEPLSLPNLKLLALCQDFRKDDFNKIMATEVLNYGIQVRDIILATAGGLEQIEFYYRNEASVNVLLDVLQNCTYEELKGLKALSLFNNNNEAVALQYNECDKLSRLWCLNLEELQLDFCLWQNVKVPFEAILVRFQKLKKLTVTGCFITMMKADPIINLKFPPLNYLEELCMGHSEVSVPVFETISTRPPKRKPKKIFRVEIDQGSGQGETRCETSAPAPLEEEDNHGEYFSVTLNLTALPKLKILNLGRMYEVEELHFQSMPNLTSFRVSSPWHLCVNLPRQSSRQKTYPLITELQLPDGLQDDGFVRLVMPHFPNVETVWINLPTVKVLRAFAFIMKDMETLKKLEVSIQFDFASSLDACILAKPSEIVPTAEEKSKILHLKEYKLWEEYAIFHQIDVPVYGTEAAEILEDEQKYAGLCVLSEKFHEEKSFTIKYVPRTLRLPGGNIHWNEDNCKFTETLIGFRRFPYSKAAWYGGPLGIFACGFNLKSVNARPMRYKKEPGIGLDSYTQPMISKKEEQDKEQ